MAAKYSSATAQASLLIMSRLLSLLLLGLFSPAISASEIWRWQDEYGRWHFTDQAPAQQTAEDISSQYRLRVPFTLIFEGQGFKSLDHRKAEIEDRLFRVYDLLENVLGLSLSPSKAFRIVIYANKEQMVASHPQYQDPKRSVPRGFFQPANDTIYLYARANPDLMVHTLVHEFFHAMMRHRQIPVWLNEGLAEYVEVISPQGLYSQIAPQPSWITTLQQHYTGSVGHFDAMLATTNYRLYRDQNSRTVIYATGWSLAWFLMSSTEGQLLLGKLLSSNPGSTSEQLINQHWAGGSAALKQQWSLWLKQLIASPIPAPHRYPYHNSPAP